MDLIDEGQLRPNQSDVRFFPTALRYGLIGGAISVVFSLISNLAGLVDYTGESSNLLVNIISIVITVGIIYFAIQVHRDTELGGYITFGRAFSVGFVAVMVAGVIGAFWMLIYFNLIDPGVLEIIKEGAMDKMESQGMSDSEMEAASGMMGFFTSPAFFALSAIIGSALLGGIISLITAAIMKRE